MLFNRYLNYAILFFLLFFCFCEVKGQDFHFCVYGQDQKVEICVDWTIQGNTIEFTAATETVGGWIAVGVNDSPQMIGTDAIVAWVNSFYVQTVQCRYNEGKDASSVKLITPCYASSPSTGFARSDSATIVKFSRSLDLGAPWKNVTSISKTQNQYIVWAVADQIPSPPTSNLTNHIYRGFQKLNFTSGIVYLEESNASGSGSNQADNSIWDDHKTYFIIGIAGGGALCCLIIFCWIGVKRSHKRRQ